MSANPFQGDIITLDLPIDDQEAVRLDRAEAADLEAIVDQVLTGDPEDQRRGQVVLLRSPRAGFGKTHLLACMREKVGDAAIVVPVGLETERPVNWVGFYQSLLQTLASTSHVSAPSQLDAMVRRLLASATSQLIKEGKIPSSDQKEACRELDEFPLRTFDFGKEDKAAVCRWFRDYYEDLRPLVVAALARRTGLDTADVTGWIDVLYRFTEADGGERQDLRDEAFRRLFQFVDPEGAADGDTDESSSEAPQAASLDPNSTPGTQEFVDAGDRQLDLLGKGRFVAFSRIVALTRPIILVLDGLDGFYGARQSGAKIAHMVAEIQERCPGVATVVSANNDLWQTIFGHHLPSALEDRLTSSMISLGGIGREDGTTLIRARLEKSGLSEKEKSDFLRFLSLDRVFRPGNRVAPRELLRIAHGKWLRFVNADLDLYSTDGMIASPVDVDGAEDDVLAPEPKAVVSEHPPSPDDIPLNAGPENAPLSIFDDGLRNFLSGAIDDISNIGRKGRGDRGISPTTQHGSSATAVSEPAVRRSEEPSKALSQSAVQAKEKTEQIATEQKPAVQEIVHPVETEQKPLPEKEEQAPTTPVTAEANPKTVESPEQAPKSSPPISESVAEPIAEEVAVPELTQPESKGSEPDSTKEEKVEAPTSLMGDSEPIPILPPGFGNFSLFGEKNTKKTHEPEVDPVVEGDVEKDGNISQDTVVSEGEISASEEDEKLDDQLEDAGSITEENFSLSTSADEERGAEVETVDSASAIGEDSGAGSPSEEEAGVTTSDNIVSEGAEAPSLDRDLGGGAPAHQASFIKIKSMLAKLRQERDGASITEVLKEPIPAPAEEAPPAITEEPVAEESSPFQKEAGAAEPSPLSSKTESSDDSISDSEPSDEKSAENPVNDDLPIFVEQATDSAVLKAFTQILDDECPDENDFIQQNRIGRLIKVAGYRFPVVRYSDFRLPEAQEKSVAKWSFENNEILFGFEPLDDVDYWKALSAFASKRALLRNELLSTATDGRDASSVKLVVFAQPREMEDIERWLDTSDRSYVDIIMVDRDDLAAVYSADTLIQRSEDGELDKHPGEVVGTLAGELDSFWRRVTLPLPLTNPEGTA